MIAVENLKREPNGPRLTFLGGAGTVTGSRHLLEIDSLRLLVDCGLFQGGRRLKGFNWNQFPVPPESLDAVLITHAHIDHTGYLLKLVREGFRGPILATQATCAPSGLDAQAGEVQPLGRLQLSHPSAMQVKLTFTICWSLSVWALRSTRSTTSAPTNFSQSYTRGN